MLRNSIGQTFDQQQSDQRRIDGLNSMGFAANRIQDVPLRNQMLGLLDEILMAQLEGAARIRQLIAAGFDPAIVIMDPDLLAIGERGAAAYDQIYGACQTG